MIYNEDCLATMARFPDGYIDLTITSPPYNLGNNHHTGNKRVQAYNDSMPEDVYQAWQVNILNELYRVTAASGSLLYNHKNRIKNGAQITPYAWLMQTPWIVKQELVWFNGSQNFDKIRFYPMTERIYWLAKSRDTKLYNTINHHDLFTRAEWPAQGINKMHARGFPEQMVSDLLSCFPSAKIIYDPFLGGGTVAVVAQKLGREWMGSEISTEYCKIAEGRLAIKV
jgi:site-specific DNA-methyltransferase (adenine-specific)